MTSLSEQYTRLQIGLQQWVDENTPTDYKVIFRHPRAPRPNLPYVSLQLGSFARISYQDAGYFQGGNVVKWFTQYEFTLFITAFGDFSFATLLEIQASTNKQAVQTHFNDYGIAYIDQLSMLDDTALINTSQEQRASLDIRFATSFEMSDNVNIIETVEGTMTVNPDSVDPAEIDYKVTK